MATSISQTDSKPVILVSASINTNSNSSKVESIVEKSLVKNEHSPNLLSSKTITNDSNLNESNERPLVNPDDTDNESEDLTPKGRLEKTKDFVKDLVACSKKEVEKQTLMLNEAGRNGRKAVMKAGAAVKESIANSSTRSKVIAVVALVLIAIAIAVSVLGAKGQLAFLAKAKTWHVVGHEIVRGWNVTTNFFVNTQTGNIVGGGLLGIATVVGLRGGYVGLKALNNKRKAYFSEHAKEQRAADKAAATKTNEKDDVPSLSEDDALLSVKNEKQDWHK